MAFSRSRVATLAAATVATFLTLVKFVAVPLHARGIAQEPLSRVCGLGHLLEAPVRGLAHVTVLRGAPEDLGVMVWCFCLALNTALCFAGSLVLQTLLRRPSPGAVAKSSPCVGEGAQSRRGFLRWGLTGTAGAGAAVLGYGFIVETRRLQVSKRSITISGLPPSLDGLRVVQITDVHLGPWITIDHVREAVRMANDAQPDLVLLTGDYVHRSAAYIEPVAQALAGLRARIGVAGVLGNHDWREGGPEMKQAMARAGIPLVDNGRRFVTVDRKLVELSAEGLCIAGVGDLWEDEVHLDAALEGVPVNMPRLLLSHNPDVAEFPELATLRYRVDLMLSGHTHGGQVRLPYLGTPIVPSRFGQKYAQGLVQGPGCAVHICRGIGMAMLPIRIGVPPEIAVIELRC